MTVRHINKHCVNLGTLPTVMCALSRASNDGQSEVDPGPAPGGSLSPVRLPGRVDAGRTTFTSPTELAAALRRAETAHGEHERRTGERDANWPDWYAEYIVSEQAGKPLPA
jgi:hypothetical protein